jgi:hypothetical protein
LLPHWIPAAIREPRSVVRSLAVALPLTLVGGLLLSLLMARLFPGGGEPVLPIEGDRALVAIVLFAPLVETLILALLLEVMLRLLSPGRAILLSAFGWAVAHSLAAPTWGLVVWGPFLVFSTLYVAWRRRGLVQALVVPATAHALHNLVALLLIRSQLAP